VLAFAMADLDEDPVPDDDSEQAESRHVDKADDDGPREPIDLTIELTDGDGHVARLPLSHVAPLEPRIETPFLKSTALHHEALSEPIFQTFRFPLADFRAANPEFKPERAVKLRLLFDRTKSGVVVFDKAAFGLQTAIVEQAKPRGESGR